MDGVQDSFELVITKIDGGEERIKVNMVELKQKTCASDSGDAGVTILILGIVAVIIACRWRKGRKVQASDVIKVNVETETLKIKCREDFHYDNFGENDY